MAIDCLQSCAYTLFFLFFWCIYFKQNNIWLCSTSGLETVGSSFCHRHEGCHYSCLRGAVDFHRRKQELVGGRLGGMIQENKALCFHAYLLSRFLLVSLIDWTQLRASGLGRLWIQSVKNSHLGHREEWRKI